MESLIDKKHYAIKEIRRDIFELLMYNFTEFLTYYRIPFSHQNIVKIFKIYVGKEIIQQIVKEVVNYVMYI